MKKLVAYFSAGGVTANTAKKLAEAASEKHCRSCSRALRAAK